MSATVWLILSVVRFHPVQVKWGKMAFQDFHSTADLAVEYNADVVVFRERVKKLYIQYKEKELKM